MSKYCLPGTGGLALHGIPGELPALQAPGGWVGQRFGARLTLAACSILGLTATVTTVAAPAVFVGTAAFIVLLLSQLLLGAAQAPVFPATAGATESWSPPKHLMRHGSAKASLCYRYRHRQPHGLVWKRYKTEVPVER
jgi:MFS family permease